METKWYHGVKWTLKPGYRGRTMAVDGVCRVYECTDWQERNRRAELIAAAPETATERDRLAAENERLKRALEFIAKGAEEMASDRYTTNRGLWLGCAETARAALSGDA